MTRLKNIADDMRRRAETSGYASALLQRGLRIRYEIYGCNRRIAIARPDAPPSIFQWFAEEPQP